MPIASILAAVLLTAIAGIHIYWALGGEAGKAGAIPSRDGIPVIRPRAGQTALVGLALLVMAGVALLGSRVLPSPLPHWMARSGCVAVALVFLARAIGDFRYVGFFKRVRGSLFAARDTIYYSPLCLLLCALFALSAVR